LNFINKDFNKEETVPQQPSQYLSLV